MPALTAGIQNQGLNNYVPKDEATILKNVISISANGTNTGATFYQSKEFTVLQDSYAIEYKKHTLTDNQSLFIVTLISKSISSSFEWTNKAGWEKVKNCHILLPFKNNEIDFDFMESFIAELEAQRIAELEAYLEVTGLSNHELTREEQQAIQNFDNVKWKEFTFNSIFNNIKQGKRLKKDDQIKGNIPFIMAGITNTGIANYISDPIVMFPKNSITIDIFGNTFYRNYVFSAGDDTGVYWSDKYNLNSLQMLFISTSMRKTLLNKYSYGHKLRSSKSLDIPMKIPFKNDEIDFEYMKTLISAIQKLVIKDVVDYTNKRIKTTKRVTNNNAVN